MRVLKMGVVGLAVFAMAGSLMAQSSTPPRLVVKYGSGEYSNVKLKAWDDTSKFGAVPSSKVALGKEVCSALNARAEGYHPQAQDENGNQIVDGGFLCVR